MREKKLIVIKRVSDASEVSKRTLDHCQFWGIERGSKTAIELNDRRMVEQALKKNCQVLAVSTASILVPLAFEISEVGRAKWRVADIMHVKIDPTCPAFRDEFIAVFADDPKGIYYDTNLWERLNLEAHFTNLINGQKAAMLAAHGSGAIDKSQFDVGKEIKPSLPDWCVFCRDEGLVVFDRESHSNTWDNAILLRDKGTRLEGIFGIWNEKIKKALKEHPIKTGLGVLAFLLAAYFARGCLVSYSTIQNQKREANRMEWETKKPVKGSISIVVANETDPEAGKLLRGVAEAFARGTITVNSNKTSSWADGKKIELSAKVWSNIVNSAQRFAAENKGEFTCKVSGNDITILADTSKVRNFTFDVSQLNGDVALVGKVEECFPEIHFNGRRTVGPRPVRATTVAAATKTMQSGDVRMDLVNNDTFVFSPNLVNMVSPEMRGRSLEELRDDAEKFWREDAAQKFAAIPQEVDSLTSEFSQLDHDYTAGFAEASQSLGILSDECGRKAQEYKTFVALCNERWRSFFAPSDIVSKRAMVLNAVNKLEMMKVKVDSRRNLVALSEGLFQFDQKEANWRRGVADTITAYNAQAMRKQNVVALIGEIAAARSRNDFSEVEAFAGRIAAMKAARLQAAKAESSAAQMARPTFSEAYIRENLGKGWAKKMKLAYGSMPGAAANIDGKVQAFEDWAVGYFCPMGNKIRTVAQAMNNAVNYADNVCYNHDTSSVPKDRTAMPQNLMAATEAALLEYADYQLTSLVRRQRKAQAR